MMVTIVPQVTMMNSFRVKLTSQFTPIVTAVPIVMSNTSVHESAGSFFIVAILVLV
jgi:hypothetical protein